jgi:hypothetical protein
MGFHTNKNASKRSTWRLNKKETSKIIGCADGQYAAKLRKFGEDKKRKMR